MNYVNTFITVAGDGKTDVALCPIESPDHRQHLDSPALENVPAMRTKRA